MNKIKIWTFVIFGGALSAILSSIGGTLSGGLDAKFNPWPGICFGILILSILKFMAIGHESFVKKIIFIIFSILAYIGAFWSSVWSMTILPNSESSYGPSDIQMYFGLFIGGMVGAMILVVAARFLLKIFSSKQIIFLMVSSGFLGVLGMWVSPLFGSVVNLVSYKLFNWLFFISLFMVWQIGIAALMVYFLQQNKNLKIT